MGIPLGTLGTTGMGWDSNAGLRHVRLGGQSRSRLVKDEPYKINKSFVLVWCVCVLDFTSY